MRSIENMLGLWASGLRSSQAIVDWAGMAVARPDMPDDSRQELFELITYGPEQCLKRARHDFSPRPARMSYLQQFCVRGIETELDSPVSALAFAHWAARGCMGEELSEPAVAFGYRLDHLLIDCEDEAAALAFVRNELPALLPQCRTVAAPFLDDEA
ncbi:hypothetical protein SAMN05216567_10495 [Variovorax sp. OK605]|uniref:hypothetical protein n=1 Tax=Variovorax sp. OK605 TaxID=1855317 RepID=UPI0008E6DEFA|nr:hypothetical protein [Variovorax sp. OK605]SFP07576.1 hypothetical protein SAMN05216567_10495 [Variovorax sp. OK605]